ncbi:hypothetical protein [Paraburkholderia sp.]|uniref:hypothetical protein n=1 Tax=Paraburkholderia sp. TaxID=1926495 RepID=UPI0025F3FE85|nr:hypothetical protein [Paraburkholderia sp.]
MIEAKAMESILESRNGHGLAYIGVKARQRGLDADFRLRAQVNELCIALFDHWCERRELTPLIYLLHAWPFLPSMHRPVEMLAASLRDLLLFHDEALDDRGRQLIGDIRTLEDCSA